MKFPIYFILIACLLSMITFSCTNQAATEKELAAQAREQRNQIQDYIGQFHKSVQQFTVDATKPGSIQGQGGTIITFDPANLETINGQPVSEKIEVELHELFTQQDFIFSIV